MEHLTDTLMGMAGLGLLFALTAWLPLKGESGGCGSCGEGCGACPAEGAGCASGAEGPQGCAIVDDAGGRAPGAPSSGAGPWKATDGS